MHTMQDVKDLGEVIRGRRATGDPITHLIKAQRNMINDMLRVEIENKQFWEKHNGQRDLQQLDQ